MRYERASPKQACSKYLNEKIFDPKLHWGRMVGVRMGGGGGKVKRIDEMQLHTCDPESTARVAIATNGLRSVSYGYGLHPYPEIKPQPTSTPKLQSPS